MTIILLSGALGFLLASVIALFLAPPLWRRAARITTKKLNQQSPRMMREGQADRDSMRAEFAVSTRKMEVKIERVKDEAASQLIELSTVEKKLDRLQGKNESQQKTIERRDSKVEKLNQKVSKQLADMGKKRDQIDSQSERLTRQSVLLNSQTTTLEENATKLETYKRKVTNYTSKEADFSTTISKQDLELKKLRSLQQQVKLSHGAKDKAHKQECDLFAKEISELKKNQEIHRTANVRFRHELGENQNKISELIRKVKEKDVKINQLCTEFAADIDKQIAPIAAQIAPLVMTSTKPSTERPPKESKKDLPEVVRPTIVPAPVMKVIDNFAKAGKTIKSTVSSNNGSQTEKPNSPAPQRNDEPSAKNSNPEEVPETPSLAERIRALQTDHPKSM